MKIFHFYRRAFCIFLLEQSLFLAARSISVATTVPPKINQILRRANISDVNILINGSRRIINGEESRSSRPYMVYLKLPSSDIKFNKYRHWLCGGVIIHEEYILTSAACIEDAKHFYVVSGTHRHNEEDDRHNNNCIKNGAKKAVWKCIPRNYVFDGHENDNIRWMNNDIAIVKVEDEFDFTRRIRGCDFIPKPICYNNKSITYENPDNRAIIAGWGTTEKYNDWVNRRSQSTTQELLETAVVLISKKHCKRRWGSRYHNIIDNYMICSKDINTEISDVCNDKYVECTDIMYSDEDEGTRRVLNPEKLVLHSAFHNESGRRQTPGGGFCENDHGGPLIYGEGSNAMVIGIISACLVKERTNKCYGPFLYTSVFKNRVLINCAIYKDVRGDCSKLFRSSKSYREVHMNWSDHPDGWIYAVDLEQLYVTGENFPHSSLTSLYIRELAAAGVRILRRKVSQVCLAQRLLRCIAICGPAMHDVAKMRRIEENSRIEALETMKYGNSTLRTFYDHADMRLENTNISSTK